MANAPKPPMGPKGGHGPGGPQGHGYQRPANLKRTVARLLSYISQYKLLLILLVHNHSNIDEFLAFDKVEAIGGSFFVKESLDKMEAENK